MSKINMLILISGVVFLSLILIKLVSVHIISNIDNIRNVDDKPAIILESRRLDSEGYVISYWNEDKFKLVLKNAEQGDVEAQAALGYLYLAGEFVREDYKKAELWLKKAAEANDAEAQFNLAYLYQKSGRTNDAIFWYRKSAALNYSEAQLNLALLLGDQEKFDINEIVSLLESSIKNGNDKAYFPLAWWYLNELNLNKEQEGLRLLKIAVQYQDCDAEFLLAELYETGDLVEKDLEKSKELYRKAKEHGSLEAVEKLKQMN